MTTPPSTTLNTLDKNNDTSTQAGNHEDQGIPKVNSDGLSLPLMSDKNSNKHLSRTLSYEKFLSENNERVILNIGGKRFETYPLFNTHLYILQHLKLFNISHDIA